MCTVSIIRFDDRIRLAFNRDEQLTRHAALPSRMKRFGERCAALPIDPQSDGTWIAVNDAGVMMALLNRTTSPVDSSAAGAISRGRIIPSLLHADSAAEAAHLARGLPCLAYQPFRLLLIDRLSTFEVVSSGTRLNVSEHMHDAQPLMFTSSGLGDTLVEGPRRALFREMLSDGHASAARQDMFHQHQWKAMPHLSVRMSRTGARTVSFTTIDLMDNSAIMEYRPTSAARSSQTHVVALQLCEMALV